MNKLPRTERARILQLLCEGMSIRAIERTTGVTKRTITTLLNDAGAALGEYQDRTFRKLPCTNVQVDEIWSFTYAKQKNVATAKHQDLAYGDTWTWTAICADTKLVFSVMVGGRDMDYARAFLADVRDRLTNRVQLNSDGHKVYLRAIRETFGSDVDHCILVKIYGNGASGQGDGARYSPSPLTGIVKARGVGNPDMDKISTSYVERQNLTMRMHMRRFARLTNGFSKKIENHVNAVSLHFAYYNFVRVHKTLRMTPAMAAGVTDRLWEMADLVAILEASEAAPAKRGPYKPKVPAA